MLPRKPLQTTDGHPLPHNLAQSQHPIIPQNPHQLRDLTTETTGDGALQPAYSTPPKPSNPDGSLCELSHEEEFDQIAKNVNDTIRELSPTYSEIGYSAQETAAKIAEIFQAVNATIESFRSNLQREKNGINSECDWLRQQIRVILAVINDSTGEKTLSLSNQGIVFDDMKMYTAGYWQETCLRADSFLFLQESLMSPNTLHSSRMFGSPPRNQAHGQFSSPESHTSLSQNVSFGGILLHAPQTSVRQAPQLSLRQCKAKLNLIFFEVMKSFVAVYRKFNEKNVQFWKNVAIYTDAPLPEGDIEFLKSIPNATDATKHSELIGAFDKVCLGLDPRKMYDSDQHAKGDTSPDHVAFIVPSPRKQTAAMLHQKGSDRSETNADISSLREINHDLVNAIRSLKLTKFTEDVVEKITREVEKSEEEIIQRVAQIKERVLRCLELIQALSLSESEFVNIQKGHVQGDDTSSEGYFDFNVFRHVQDNPLEFGVMDYNLEFVARLEQTLQTMKDEKQKERDTYVAKCTALWEKLGENSNYINTFLLENSLLTYATLKNLRLELQRLYLKRAEHVDSFIATAQSKIRERQKTLLYSDRQCAEFRYFAYDVRTVAGDKEEILNAHDSEIERLDAEIAQRQPVLSLYAQLNELVENQKFLTESMKDSSRLHSRNLFRIILHEEKLRKKIDKNWPRAVAALKQEISVFNEQQRAQGLALMTAGNEDMLERVQCLEAEMAAHGVKQPVKRPASPVKVHAAAAPRSASPKRNQSPMKVVKPPVQRRSPVLSDPNPMSRATGHKAAHPRSKLSPVQPTGMPARSARSSPKYSDKPSVGIVKLGKTVLAPLKTSLAPADRRFGGPLLGTNGSADSTLYSTCARMSPLRAGSNTNVAMLSLSPVKYALQDIHFDELDKENSFAEA